MLSFPFRGRSLSRTIRRQRREDAAWHAEGFSSLFFHIKYIYVSRVLQIALKLQQKQKEHLRFQSVLAVTI